MDFTRIETVTRDFIECFWFLNGHDERPAVQKIVPDGFPEVIFHKGDPFRILQHAEWRTQEPVLLAGQLNSHFYLESPANVKVVGIKFQPAALSSLFGLDMSAFADRVVPLVEVLPDACKKLSQIVFNTDSPEIIAREIESFVGEMLPVTESRPVSKAVALIMASKGKVTVNDLCIATGVTERKLERDFKRMVGLPPGRYIRIIRFNHIFEHVRNGDDWLSIVEKSGFYDQPHFIRDFQAFTGEVPSAYAFKEKNIANFFANREPGHTCL